MSDFFRGTNGKVQIDVMDAALDESGKTVAVVVLRSDADSFLYPLINVWPVPSRSAETLLIERQGDDVIFLNNLRHSPRAALSLRMPITLRALPADEAAIGKVGMFEGKDYRGVNVLADLRPVPHTPWFMIAKIDQSEILEEANYRGNVVIIFVALFIAMAIIATAYTYRRRQAGIYRAMYHAEVERKEVQEEFKAILYSIGDAVITTDVNGLVKQMNHVAESLTGWTEQQAKGVGLDEVFRIVNEESRAIVESPVWRVLSDGMVAGLANHTILISKDGNEYPIADSGAPIKDEFGNLTGVVLIFRDRTKERAAEEKANRLAAIVQSSDDAVIGKTLDGIITSWNKGAEKIYGYAESEMIGRPVSLLVPDGNEDEVPKILDRLKSGENIEHYGTVRRRKDGREIQVSLTVSPIHDGGGKVVAASTIARDVTERNQSEIALRESQQMLKTVLDTIPVRVYWKDRDGIFLGCNTEFAKDAGFDSPDEIIGKDDSRLAWHDLAGPYRADDNQVMESGVPRLALEKPQPYDKGIRWLRSNKVPLRNAEGEVVGVLGTYEDVTEAKRAASLLAHEQYLLNSLLENTVDRIYFKDTEGRFIRVSASTATASGLSKDQLIGKTDLDLFTKEQAQRTHAQEQEVINSGNPLIDSAVQETWVGRPSTWASVTKVPLRDQDGKIVGIFGITRDITERKRTEEILRKSEDNFQSIMSSIHDIVYKVDGETKEFTYLSPAFEKLLGYTREDIRQMGGRRAFLSEVIQESKFDEQDKGFDQLAVSKGEIPTLATWWRCKDGRSVYLEDRAVPIYDGDRLVSTQGILSDITERKNAEIALRESQQMLKTVLDTIPVRVFWKDRNGIFLGCNAAFTKDSGFDSADGIIGKDDSQMIWREQAGLYRADDIQVMASGISRLAYEEPQPFDHGTRWLRTNKVPLRNAKGDVVGILGTYEDVTAAKQAASLLAYERYLLNALLNNSVDCIYFKDTEGHFTRLSASMAAASGLIVNEFLGKTDFDLFTKQQAQETFEQEQKIIKTGKPIVNLEIQQKWVDRPNDWVSVTKVPLRDQAGKIVGLIGITRGIGERKNAEIALRESEERFRGLVEGSAAAIWIHNGKRFLYANPATLQMTGYTAEEFYKVSPGEFVHPDFRESVMKRAAERMEGKDAPKQYEYQIMKKSGEPIWIDFSGAAIDYQGNPAIIASAYDITERKKLEGELMQAQKMEGIGRLAGGVAHDYNNMLGVIIGYSDLLINQMDKEDPTFRYVELIASAAKRGADITRQLLAFARREIVSPRVLNPNEAIDSIQKMLESLIGENVELMFLPGADIWNVRMDKTQARPDTG